jgi:hypothetical protein
MVDLTPIPVELTRDIVNDLEARADAGALPALYVLRGGHPTWVTVSCEGVVANIQSEIVEPDPRRPGGFRIRSGIEAEVD